MEKQSDVRKRKTWLGAWRLSRAELLKQSGLISVLDGPDRSPYDWGYVGPLGLGCLGLPLSVQYAMQIHMHETLQFEMTSSFQLIGSDGGVGRSYTMNSDSPSPLPPVSITYLNSEAVVISWPVFDVPPNQRTWLTAILISKVFIFAGITFLTRHS